MDGDKSSFSFSGVASTAAWHSNFSLTVKCVLYHKSRDYLSLAQAQCTLTQSILYIAGNFHCFRWAGWIREKLTSNFFKTPTYHVLHRYLASVHSLILENNHEKLQNPISTKSETLKNFPLYDSRRELFKIKVIKWLKITFGGFYMITRPLGCANQLLNHYHKDRYLLYSLKAGSSAVSPMFHSPSSNPQRWLHS